MPEPNLYLISMAGTAVATSVLHTLIPDHWLPFVLIGRARRWSVGTVALVAGLSATIHALLSVGLGLGALALDAGVARALGEKLETIGGLLLVVFGVVYAVWSWSKGGHFHPGGRLLHGTDPSASCSGDEGDTNPRHLHYHADDALISDQAGWGGFGLALIIGLNPCVLVLPLMIAAAPRGVTMVAVVTAAYAIPTVLLMVGLSIWGVRVGRQVGLPWMARHAEAASGLLIAALGVVFLFLGH